MRILVLVLAKDSPPWSDIEKEGQDLTWKQPHSNVEILRYVGEESKLSFKLKIVEQIWKLQHQFKTIGAIKELGTDSFFARKFNSILRKIPLLASQQGKTIKIEIPDRYFLIGLKTLAAFIYALENFDFDFVYRTNISSYVEIERLFEFGKNLPSGDVYSGPFANHEEITFASGSGYFLSRSLIEKVIESRNDWNHLEIDDVALGQLTSNFQGLKLVPTGRIDFESPKHVYDVSQSDFESVFHYRCKQNDSIKTIEIMKNIHGRNLNR